MENQNFKLGDVVVTKSREYNTVEGSPIEPTMTICETLDFEKTGKVVCEYFNKLNYKYEEKYFFVDQLKLFKDGIY